MLTAKQIVEKGIIFMNPKYMDPSKNEYGLKLELEPAQIGIDLHMVSMARVVGKGYIPLKGNFNTWSNIHYRSYKFNKRSYRNVL